MDIVYPIVRTRRSSRVRVSIVFRKMKIDAKRK